MTTGIPCCGNCPKFHQRYCEFVEDKLSTDEINMITVVGCLSHPNARTYLMKGIVEELECARIQYAKASYETCNPKDIAYSDGLSEGYNKAISLIKGEVGQ